MKDLNLIRKITWGFAQKSQVEFDELFSEAALAYSEALLKYDPERGTKFSTFAYQCMRNHLISVCKERYQNQTARSQEFNEELYPLESASESFEAMIEDWPQNCKEIAKLVISKPGYFLGRTGSMKRSNLSGNPKDRVAKELKNKGWRGYKVKKSIQDMEQLLST